MRLKLFLILGLMLLNPLLRGQTIKEQFEIAIFENDTKKQLTLTDPLMGQYTMFTLTYYGLMLNSLPRNAVLLTSSRDDTFPLKILQLKNGLRQDVKIISLGMLQDSSYRGFINQTHKLQLTNTTKSSQMALLSKSVRNLHISTTIQSTLWFKSNYFLDGLTVQSSSKNQVKNLTAFYTKIKDLRVTSLTTNGWDKDLLRNLLPPLITLYKSGEESTELRTDILQLAKIVGEFESVNKMIARE